MPAGTGQADGPAPAAQAARTAFSLDQVENWHHEVVARVDGWDWIRALNDRLTAVLGPWRERHQGNPVLELMHGGRWLGHPLHPALSDLPIGLWAGALVLDLTGSDPPPGGPDPATVFSAAGIVAAVATAATGVVDWTVSDDQDRRLGLFHGVLNTAALGLQGLSLAARLTGRRRTEAGWERPVSPSPEPPPTWAVTWCSPRRSWSAGWRAPTAHAAGSR